MADAWNGSWGVSWGSSWGDGVTPVERGVYGGAPTINLVRMRQDAIRREDDLAAKAMEGLDFD